MEQWEKKLLQIWTAVAGFEDLAWLVSDNWPLQKYHNIP